jgi:hypothetical protein
MSRSFIHLRRALFGASCAIVFGFGATQALAAPGSVGDSECLSYQQQACSDRCALYGAKGRCSRVGSWVDCECYLDHDVTGPIDPAE